MKIDMPMPFDARGVYFDQNVVILGASGFIGNWVSRRLFEAGAELHFVVRDEQVARNLHEKCHIKGIYHEIDLPGSQEQLAKLFAEINPAIVFNLCGYGVDRSERDEAISFRINEALVKVVCDALGNHHDKQWKGQQFIHVGSALEYGEDRSDLDESVFPQPSTLYGRSKLAGTLQMIDGCKENHLKGITARLFMVYGAGEHDGRLLPSLLALKNNPKALPLTDGNQQRDFTYIEDVVEGLLRLGAIEISQYPLVNLASGRLHSVKEFINKVANEFNIDRSLLKFGELPTRAEEMSHLPVSNQRLKTLIDWTPSGDLNETVKRLSVYCSAQLS